MKTMTILGTRPELIKMSEVIKQLDKYTKHVFVHTGQNYDYELDEIFYKDLGLRKPDYNLSMVGIGMMLHEVETVLIDEKPDVVLILGDTNSALCGYVAKRMKIPVFHLEAGNRCFDDNVPEEINRRILDHISDINLVYTEHARRNLLNEGIKADRIYLTGSPMAEIINHQDVYVNDSKGKYYLVSIHREENLDNQKNLNLIVKSINKLARSHNVILTCHPRLANKHVKFNKNVKVCKPFGYNEYLNLQVNAICVISDSGTLAEESSILGFPAVTIRDAMERPEVIDTGGVIKANPHNILECVEIAKMPKYRPDGYGTDNFSDRVINIVFGYTDFINKYVWGKNE